ncbi:uncharacterized protein LOC104651455 [Saimiri boliviensis]|uniref:uncharacterized protein LOC104651455 n=1 Tax=Saimiri boliviensis TaxID=27679 RepID=UPI003D775F1F
MRSRLALRDIYLESFVSTTLLLRHCCFQQLLLVVRALVWGWGRIHECVAEQYEKKEKKKKNPSCPPGRPGAAAPRATVSPLRANKAEALFAVCVRARGEERGACAIWAPGGARGQSVRGAAVPDPPWGPTGAGGGTNYGFLSSSEQLWLSGWPKPVACVSSIVRDPSQDGLHRGWNGGLPGTIRSHVDADTSVYTAQLRDHDPRHCFKGVKKPPLKWPRSVIQEDEHTEPSSALLENSVETSVGKAVKPARSDCEGLCWNLAARRLGEQPHAGSHSAGPFSSSFGSFTQPCTQWLHKADYKLQRIPEGAKSDAGANEPREPLIPVTEWDKLGKAWTTQIQGSPGSRKPALGTGGHYPPYSAGPGDPGGPARPARAGAPPPARAADGGGEGGVPRWALRPGQGSERWAVRLHRLRP